MEAMILKNSDNKIWFETEDGKEAGYIDFPKTYVKRKRKVRLKDLSQ